MPSAVQIHAHEDIAGLYEGEVYRHVGLAAGVGLHVGVVGAEELAGPLARYLFDYVHMFAAAVKAPSGIAFGVFVCEMAADRLHYRGGSEILAGNELDMVALALEFLLHYGKNLLVGASKVFKVHLYTAPRS